MIKVRKRILAYLYLTLMSTLIRQAEKNNTCIYLTIYSNINFLERHTFIYRSYNMKIKQFHMKANTVGHICTALLSKKLK